MGRRWCCSRLSRALNVGISRAPNYLNSRFVPLRAWSKAQKRYILRFVGLSKKAMLPDGPCTGNRLQLLKNGCRGSNCAAAAGLVAASKPPDPISLTHPPTISTLLHRAQLAVVFPPEDEGLLADDVVDEQGRVRRLTVSQKTALWRTGNMAVVVRSKHKRRAESSSTAALQGSS